MPSESRVKRTINTTESDPDLRGLSDQEILDKHMAELTEANGGEPLANHELPPELRQAEQPIGHTNRGKPIFTEEQAMHYGFSDAEIIALRQTGAMAGNLPWMEYDEEAEQNRMAKLRQQHTRSQQIDGGDLYAVQISHMERYFKGLEKNAKTGRFCERQVTTLAEPKIVGINGYVFNIPAFVPVPLPTEVLDILEQSALALNQHAVYSAVMVARGGRKITLEDFMSAPAPESLYQRLAAAHPVRQTGDLRPYAGTPAETVQAMMYPRG